MKLFEAIGRRDKPRRLRLTFQFVTEPDGNGFHAYSPSLPGLHADGATHDEAARNFASAIPAYLESLKRHGDQLPVGAIQLVPSTPDDAPDIPPGAFLRHVQDVTLEWPSSDTSGIS